MKFSLFRHYKKLDKLLNFTDWIYKI
jgi:hypothetical protein